MRQPVRRLALVSLFVALFAAAGSSFASESGAVVRVRVVLRESATVNGRGPAAATEVAASCGGRIDRAPAAWPGQFEMTVDRQALDLLRSDSHVRSVEILSSVPHQATTASAWDSGAFLYDGAGNITQIGTDRYKYDSVSRVVSATVNGTGNTQTYTYDAFGNRMSAARANGSIGCGGSTVCESSPAISSATNQVTGGGAQYDSAGAGNLVALGTYTYAYDATGMMKSSSNGSSRREFIYTADDERLATDDHPVNDTSAATWTWTVRDLEAHVLREFTSTGATGSAAWTWKKDYIWRGSSLLATESAGGQRLHFHLDHLGTPRLVTNQAGQVAGRHDYYAFGTEAASSTLENPEESLKFTGHEWDGPADANALTYMHARFYSATMGRFLSVDKSQWWQLQFGNESDQQRFRAMLAQPQNWNRYSYVRNNPMNLTDPTGNDACVVNGEKIQCRVVVVYNKETNKGALYLIGKVGKTEKILLQGKVVVGQNGKTPTGTFHASSWEKDHTSTLYGWQANTPWSKSPGGLNAFGPFQLHMKELEGRGIWIHGTMGPGSFGSSEFNYFVSPASHGCVRCANPTIMSLHEMMPAPRGNEVTISTDPDDAPEH